MAFDYSWGIQKFIFLCDKKFEQYIEERRLKGRQKELTIQRYVEERELLLEQVKQRPKYLKGLWVCALMEAVQQKSNVIIRNAMVQCPFIMYLFQMASYNVLEEGFLDAPYLYEKSNLSVFDYAVTKDFYAYAGRRLEKLFEACGYTLIWVKDEDSDFAKYGQPSGFVITGENFSYHKYANHLDVLYDGTICLRGEFVWSEDGIIDEEYCLEPLKVEGDIDVSTVTREDLLKELCKRTDDIKQAYRWAEEIRRGKEYVPSKWNVLERYHRRRLVGELG